MHVLQQHLAPAVAISILILDFLFDVGQVLTSDVPLEVLGERLGGGLEVALVVLEYHGLVVLAQVVREHVCVHQSLPALAQDVYRLLQELHLNPAHVVLLHFLHLLLDGGVELGLEAQRLHVVHVAVAVEQVALQRRPRPLLSVASCLRFVFIVPVTVVPAATVRFPGPEADPAEVCLAVLVLAHHVVAATVLLDRHVAFWALLRVCRYPVGRFRIVVTFLDPLPEQAAAHGVVPVLPAGEAERVSAAARHRRRLHVGHLDGVAAVRGRTPAQQSVTLNKTIGDDVLVLELDSRVAYQSHDGRVVHEDVARVSRARYCLTKALLHYFSG